jgi:transcriptional regulator of aromatic amino acid metabolism
VISELLPQQMNFIAVKEVIFAKICITGSMNLYSFPSLTERNEDLMLFQIFLEKSNQELNKNVLGFSLKCMAIFQNYRWPEILGNQTVLKEQYF